MRKPAFWIAYAIAALLALAIAARLFPLAIPIVNLDVKVSRTEAIASARALATKLHIAPAGARVAARFAHDGTTQNYVELEGGGKAAFADLTRGDRYSPYWWEVRLFTLGAIEETIIRLSPNGAPAGFARRLPETYVRDAARKALDAASARAIAETRARDDWGIDLRAVSPARAIAANAAFRPRRSQLYLRAPRAARRRANQVAADGRRRRIDRRRAVRAHSRIVRSPLRRPAQRQQPDRESRDGIGRPSLRHRRMHPRGAVARAQALAALASRDCRRPCRRQPARVRVAGLGRHVMVRRGHDGNRRDVLVEAGRRRRADRRRGRSRLRARVHGRRKPLAARIPASAAIVAPVVARRRGFAAGRGPHAGRLSVRADRAGARRCVLLRNESLAGLVATVGGADRSQHSRLGGARTHADRHFAAGRLHGRERLSRDSVVARRVDRRALRPPHARRRAGRAVAGVDLWRRACELSGVSRVFAAGRVVPARDRLGAHLPALRPLADDPAARDVRSHAVRDSGLPRRCARRTPATGAGDRRGVGAAGCHRRSAGAGRPLAGAAGGAA